MTQTTTRTTKTTGECLRCTGTGRLPTYSHVEAGRCFECGGSGSRSYSSQPTAAKAAPVTSAIEYYREARTGRTVCLRYGKSGSGHVIFTHDANDELSYDVFTSIEEARDAWRYARENLKARGFEVYQPY